jgi:hypothetical protein
MLSIFALASFLFVPGCFSRDLWDVQIRRPDTIDDQVSSQRKRTSPEFYSYFLDGSGKCLAGTLFGGNRLQKVRDGRMMGHG